MKKSKYENYTKEQLLEKIKQLEKHSYGLVWEDKPEEVADLCETQLPVLKEDKSKEIISDPKLPFNYIIEGDNYHSLFTLNFTHKKKIDVIYIDPPYNTGNKSWRYNNDYIDNEDPFKHSKWLSFMNKRLRLAKQLLKSDGILICAIDDNELFGLGLLLDKIFNEKNRIGIIPVRNNPPGRAISKYFATCHEYYLFYAKNKSEVDIINVPIRDLNDYKFADNISAYKRKSLSMRGHSSFKDRPNCYYPIYVDLKLNKISFIKFPNSIEILPHVGKDGKIRVWDYSKESMGKLIEENNIEIVLEGKNKIILYKKERPDRGSRPKSIWIDPKYDSSAYGASLLKKFFNNEKVFDYPKSLYAVMDAIFVSSKNKKAIILDFFAGSGTTAHAIMELNKEDVGNRQFILCTNNENNICTEVTYPRVEKVIKGYADKEGIPANVKYFTQTFVNNVLSDNDKRELVNRSTELLCMAENTFNLISKRTAKKDFAIFSNTERLTAIIYDESHIDECKNHLNKLNSSLPTVIYVFSYDHTYFPEDFENLNIVFTVKPIPEAILNVYRKINKLRKK